MIPEDFNQQLLTRYLTGQCTEEERNEIEKWISQNKDHKKKLIAFKRILEVTGNEDRLKMSNDGVDAKKNWKELKKRLTRETNFGKQKTGRSHRSTFQATSIHSTTQKVVRVAAILLIAGLIGVLSYQNFYQPEPAEQKPVFREIATEHAQRANLTLEDGTQVMLNAGSNLRLPTKFEADVREVFLEGEAYFEVANNVGKPFIIYSRGSSIRVLGTSFAVRSYPDDEQVQVVVKEGRVSFTAEEQSGQGTILSADQLGIYKLGSNHIQTDSVNDMELYMSWRKGYLKFNQTPMTRVAKDLERRYGVNVTFKNSEIKEELLTSFLKSRSIKNVLNVIAMTLDIEYRLSDGNVFFYTE